MASVNKVILVGHLGRDPEIRTFQNGGRLCNLRLATSETWRDKATGERRERTDWHTVVITNDGLIGVAERFLKKGSKVYVEGQLQHRKHTDQQGVDRYYTEVVLKPYHGELVLLDSTDTGRRGTPEDYDRTDAPRGGNSNSTSQEMGDDIPY